MFCTRMLTPLRSNTEIEARRDMDKRFAEGSVDPAADSSAGQSVIGEEATHSGEADATEAG